MFSPRKALYKPRIMALHSGSLLATRVQGGKEIKVVRPLLAFRRLVLNAKRQRLVASLHFNSEAREGRPFSQDQARSKRSAFITLFHAATKSCTNFVCESS